MKLPRFFNDMPSQQTLEELCQVPQYTPDLGILSRRPGHLVFNYGEDLDMPRICDAFTVSKMTLWNKQKNGDGITAIALRVKELRKARIKGGLYFVSTDQLQSLDNTYRNTVEFARKRAPIFLPKVTLDKQCLPVTSAWMYLAMRPRDWMKKIDWDTSFYKNRGEFAPAELFEAQKDPLYRQLQMPNFYAYSPQLPPSFKMQATPHLRSNGSVEAVRAEDNRIREEAEKQARWAVKEPEQPRKFIYITSNAEDKPSDAA